MLKVLFQIILLFLVVRLMVPVFRGIGRLFSGRSEQTRFRPKSKENAGISPKRQDYSELSPYEIEDAEFEEINTDKEVR
jgi:hypothetical protein